MVLKKLAVFMVLSFSLTLSSCASRDAARAEEYFTIGMAFFELGRFTEAETWLNRAQAADRTMVASEYNLGRIAYETGRYADAVSFFERVLAQDPDNVMALKAAAYSRIRKGDLEIALGLYERVLELVPESADDGFNYALVLYAMERYEESEEVLDRFPFALEENPPSLLLLARVYRAQDKPEAIDSYANWLLINDHPNPQGIYEYAQVLEANGFYARAIEQYDDALEALPQNIPTLSRSTIRFEKAKLLLTVDPNNDEGIEEFNTAITDGFSDTEAIQALVDDERILRVNRDDIQRALDIILDRVRAEEEEDNEEEEEGDDDDNEDT